MEGVTLEQLKALKRGRILRILDVRYMFVRRGKKGMDGMFLSTSYDDVGGARGEWFCTFNGFPFEFTEILPLEISSGGPKEAVATA